MKKLLSLAVALFTTVALAVPAGAKVAYRTTVKATGYAPGCGDSGGVTASGAHTGWGTVAVSLRQFRFGTHFFIPGYGRGTAQDTGGAIGWGHVDLWFSTCHAANAWGVRYVTVNVLR